MIQWPAHVSETHSRTGGPKALLSRSSIFYVRSAPEYVALIVQRNEPKRIGLKP
jgi:hypothetical protein